MYISVTVVESLLNPDTLDHKLNTIEPNEIEAHHICCF